MFPYLFQISNARKLKMEPKSKKIAPLSSAKLLQNYVINFIKDNDLPITLASEIPKKWEKYGDFLLFNEKAFSSNIWQKQGESFWLGICQIFKCKRLGLKTKITDDGFRTPNVKIIIGNDPWILYTDNSVKYTWNVEKNMFCAGNAPERHRIARLNCLNEVVVDLFAGIGYFTLPFLVHAGAKFVHACEWNPNAVEALKRNLKLNKVEDKCKIYEGDNRLFCPKKIADRINLGLIPSSEKSWKVACEALKLSGGVLHLHGNVETKNSDINCNECIELIKNDVLCNRGLFIHSSDKNIIANDIEIIWKRKQWFVWAVHVLHSLLAILIEINKDNVWKCCIDNVHFVKSYAPHVDHLVLDVNINAVR